MRIIKLILLGIILVGIVLLSLANRGDVTVRLLPEGLDGLLPGAAIDLPLFVVSLISIVVGLAGPELPCSDQAHPKDGILLSVHR